MKLPRDLSGNELVQALCREWGYRRVHQVGSHVILETDEPKQQRLSIPDHAALRIGTLNGILRTVAAHKGVDRRELLRSIR